MNSSLFDIFSVGIGPSSSHTVGPMRAAFQFIQEVISNNNFDKIDKIKCDFYGSLALTGKGHGTDTAFLLGIQGFTPETINSDNIKNIIQTVKDSNSLELSFDSNKKNISFHTKKDLKFHRRITLPYHPNGMSFAAFDSNNKPILEKTYFSIGGGFIVEGGKQAEVSSTNYKVKHKFSSAKELIQISESNNLSISDIILENEKSINNSIDLEKSIIQIWKYMNACISRGFKNEGILPGGLNVKRRAPELYKRLKNKALSSDPLISLDWVNLYALSVNEENASGGQVITAPTNGAAGIIPAVIKYYLKFIPSASEKKVVKFLATASAIGMLYKANASISGAEVGCQGEVGVACSMAAGALCEVLGGNVKQVENAAEIAMEHNLGLTCDPIGGLVQIPCIERNAMGAIKAINSARMALQGDGSHYVSLDKVIATMRQTGLDMKKQYKETSRGGLAVNLPEC